MNYFAIERGETYLDHVVLKSNNDEVFLNYLDLTYDEMKHQKDLEDFVIAVMDAMSNDFNEDNDQTIITLIGEDNIFIWSIIMGHLDGEIHYSLVDWKQDGKNYRYEPS